MSAKIFCFVLCTLVVSIVLKGVKSGLTPIITALASITIIVSALSVLKPSIDFITSLSNKVNLENNYLEIIFKCTAICFLGNFATQLCKDSGENTLAYSSEFICRCTVISLTLPIYVDLFNWIIKLWENV